MKRNKITVKQALERGIVTKKLLDSLAFVHTPAQVVSLVLSERRDERMDRETYRHMTPAERDAHDNR